MRPGVDCTRIGLGTMPLFRLIYCSKNLISGSTEQILDEIDRLIEVAAARNKEDRITGALLFNRGRFAQVLEGPRTAVEATFSRIRLDPRHEDIVVLQAEATTQRAFEGWGMAFVGNSTRIDNVYKTVSPMPKFEPDAMSGEGILGFLMVLVKEKEEVPQVSSAQQLHQELGA